MSPATGGTEPRPRISLALRIWIIGSLLFSGAVLVRLSGIERERAGNPRRPGAPPPPRGAFAPPYRDLHPLPPPEAWGIVRVLDAETDEPLDDATVQWVQPLDGQSWRLHTLEPSPGPGTFAYSGPAGLVSFVAAAPGRVAPPFRGVPVEVPVGPGFVHQFRLARAGGLRVRFVCADGPASPELVTLRLPADATAGVVTSVHLTVADGVAERTDLAAGEYGIEVRPGIRFRPVEPRTARVAAGETTEIRVELERGGPAGSVEGRVTAGVRFHRAWGDRVTAVRLTDGDVGPGSTDWRRPGRRVAAGAPETFDLGPVPEGEYWLEVLPQVRRRVRIPAGGAALDVEVPEPARLRVRVVDDASGAAIPGATLLWHLREAGLNSYELETVEERAGTGEFDVLVPPGAPVFQVRAPGWTSVPSLDDAGGHHYAGPLAAGAVGEFTVRMLRAGSVRVRVRCDGALLQRSGPRLFLSRAAGESGAAVSRVAHHLNGGPGVFRLDDLAPGRYVLDADDLDGTLQPIEPRVIEVAPDRTTEVEIDVARRE